MMLLDKNNEPATISTEEYSWLIELPPTLVTQEINYYYIELSSLEKVYYVLNPYKNQLENFSLEHILLWRGLQKVNNTYEPTIICDKKLYKGYPAIFELLGIPPQSLVSTTSVDNFLKRYCYFNEKLVHFKEGELKTTNQGKIPVFWFSYNKCGEGFYGYTGLKRMFPYTNINTLYHYYNKEEHYWKRNQRIGILNAQDIIKKYKIQAEYDGYYGESYKGGFMVTTIKELVQTLRKVEEVITDQVIKELPLLLNKPKKVDWLIDKYKIKLYPEEGGFCSYYTNERNERVVLTSKNKLKQEFSLSPKQLHEMWETLEDNSSLHS